MGHEACFSRNRTAILEARDKQAVLRELVGLIARGDAALDPESILARVNEREAVLATRVSPEIALPHARVPGLSGTVAAVGLCRFPVAWDTDTEHPVRLIILITGDGNDHLEVLAWLAARLTQPERLAALLGADSAAAVYDTLVREMQAPTQGTTEVVMSGDSRLILDRACDLAVQLGIAALCYHVSGPNDILPLPRTPGIPVYIILAAGTPPAVPGAELVLTVPFRNLDRINKVEIALIDLVSRGCLGKNDKVLSILGPPDAAALDTIIVSDTADYRFLFPPEADAKPADLELRVFIRMLQLANELAQEGREGKPVGTLYVLGDSAHVEKFSQQLVVNPFGGYKEEDRNVLDPGLQATIKEFSKIDGACLIRGDGVLLSCGTYIKAGTEGDAAEQGYGARHAAAAGISAVTDALAIAVSESTRRVSVFRQGRRIMYF